MGKAIYTSKETKTDLKAKDIFPMNWRFFPTIDPQVDAYLSRDLDSEFNEREIAGEFKDLFFTSYLYYPFKSVELRQTASLLYI